MTHQDHLSPVLLSNTGTGIPAEGLLNLPAGKVLCHLDAACLVLVFRLDFGQHECGHGMEALPDGASLGRDCLMA